MITFLGLPGPPSSPLLPALLKPTAALLAPEKQLTSCTAPVPVCLRASISPSTDFYGAKNEKAYPFVSSTRRLRNIPVRDNQAGDRGGDNQAGDKGGDNRAGDNASGSQP